MNQNVNSSAPHQVMRQRIGTAAVPPATAPVQYNNQPVMTMQTHTPQPLQPQPPGNPVMGSLNVQEPTRSASDNYAAACNEVEQNLHRARVDLARAECLRRRLKMDPPNIEATLVEALAANNAVGVPHAVLRDVFGAGKTLDAALKNLQDTGRIREEGERKNRVVYLLH